MLGYLWGRGTHYLDKIRDCTDNRGPPAVTCVTLDSLPPPLSLCPERDSRIGGLPKYQIKSGWVSDKGIVDWVSYPFFPFLTLQLFQL